MLLAAQLLATRRDQAGYAYFHERAEARPDQPLFLALEGVFQARLTGKQSLLRRLRWLNEAMARLDRAVAQAPGLTTYFRGVVLAELPGVLHKAGAAVADLEWVLANKERFPIGLRRSVYRSLARAYSTLGRRKAAQEALQHSGYQSLDADQAQFVTDYWFTVEDGVHFGLPRLVEPAPGVYVAQGYDFADFAFVLTDDGIVAIDAGTTEAHARAALDDLRRISHQPIRQVLLTHAHWDHIGGLGAMREPASLVIARDNYADELRIINSTGMPLGSFFGANRKHPLDFAPDRLVGHPETLGIGGVEFGLYPVRGGETADGLLIHLPSRGVLFVGDALMPELGAPFLPEGSIEGLFETLHLIQDLAPRVLIHGHTPLTDNFRIETIAGLEAALRDLYEHILDAIRDGTSLAETLHQNYLPKSLSTAPSMMVPFMIMRDNVIQRMYHQRTGYWKSDGEGVEQFAQWEWAAALDLLGGGRERAFTKTVRTLLDQSDAALALKLADLGLQQYARSQALAKLRRQALDRLRERHQQLDPFKFILYSGLAGADLLPVETEPAPVLVEPAPVLVEPRVSLSGD